MAQNMTDYEAARRGFRLEVPRVFNAARDIVDARAAAEPGKTAVVAVDPSGEHARRVSFADLAHASDRAANFLAAHGVRKGDRVFVMLPRVPAWHEVAPGMRQARRDPDARHDPPHGEGHRVPGDRSGGERGRHGSRRAATRRRGIGAVPEPHHADHGR